MNLSSDDLNKVMYRQSQKNLIPYYLGTLSSDEVEISIYENRPYKELECCFITNYDTSNESGSHWVGFMLPNNDGKDNNGRDMVPKYFDSFGFAPDNDDKILNDITHFKDFLTDVAPNRAYWYNKFDYQSLDATTCGAWSAVWISRGGGNISPAQNIDNSQERDKWVVKKYDLLKRI